MILTIKLSGFDLFEKRLKPAKGGRVTTNPKKLDTTKRAELSVLLTVPNVFQNGRERSDAYKGTLDELGGDGVKGHIPMPAPMSTTASLSKTSSAGAP